MSINAPRGTQDVLPSESYQWQYIEHLLLEVAARFGFSEIRTPTFEQLDLFCRSVGDTTDVVQKEMFEVKAQKGTDIFALKPEGTAGAVRASIERGLLNDALPLKVCYVTPCFRHEKPQAGRLREFHQFGCEMFGAQSPAADAELIALASHIFPMLGLSGMSLHLNSIGCKTCREEYYKALREYFSQHVDVLCPTCLTRLEKNPMRILDCKNPECHALVKDAPIVTDYLCEDCASHFQGVQKRLTNAGISFVLDPTIVRGLDYYTKTVFEFISDEIGAQGTVLAGGRYDGLVEELGGKPTPALGFAMGLERVLLLMKAQCASIPRPHRRDLYIASVGDAANEKACLLTNELRNNGFFVDCDLMGRSVKAQMKYADKIGARLSMVLGEDELKSGKAAVKNMSTGEQKEVRFDDDLGDYINDTLLTISDRHPSETVDGDMLQELIEFKSEK